MIRPALLVIAALALLPALASAQAIKCRDAASGKTLYTDQPCEGGQVVVPAPTEEEIRRDAEAAAQAREDALQRAQIALERDRLQAQLQAAQAAAQAQQSPANSDDCRQARAQATALTASPSADPEQIRTARYNAALACGQPPPPDLTASDPYYYPSYYLPAARPRHGAGYTGQPGALTGGGFGVPVQPPKSAPPPAPPSPPARPKTSPPRAPAAAGVSAGRPAPAPEPGMAWPGK